MKRISLVIFVFVLSMGVMAFAQHGHSGSGAGNMGGMGAGMGSGTDHGAGMGHDSGMGRNSGNTPGANSGTSAQRPLNQAQINGGAFRMLERKYPNLTSAQLQSLYQSSGAKNFGQFVSAMVVSKNLGLDYNQVLGGLKDGSLGKTLQTLGVSKSDAKSAIKKAHDEIADADKAGSKES